MSPDFLDRRYCDLIIWSKDKGCRIHTRCSRRTCFNQLVSQYTLRSGIRASAIIPLRERQITNLNISPQFLPMSYIFDPFASCLAAWRILCCSFRPHTNLHVNYSFIEIYVEYVVLSWSPLYNPSVLFLHRSCIQNIWLSIMYAVDKKCSPQYQPQGLSTREWFPTRKSSKCEGRLHHLCQGSKCNERVDGVECQ